MHYIKQLYIKQRFFVAWSGIVCLFLFAFVFPFLLPLVSILALVLVGFCGVDLGFLFQSNKPLSAGRIVGHILSLGDKQTITLSLQNNTKQAFACTLIDELPEQLQERDEKLSTSLAPEAHQTLSYIIRPLNRGAYFFDRLHVFLSGKIGFFERRISFSLETKVAVYPSVIQMKQFELKASNNATLANGVKKMRRIGHNYEFDHIKNYTKGDDYRSINWKVTGKSNALMVNQYEDEKAQQVYSIIDNSRNMRMPFNGLTLLDHAINTALVLSNISLHKYDKAGLVTFHHALGSFVRAERSKNQLRLISEKLYNEKEYHLEANLEALYSFVRNNIKTRSLLFLFTNYESQYALQRALPVLRKLNSLHLLVVVFFENTEISRYALEKAHNLDEIYYKTMAEKLVFDKKQLSATLRQFGIQSIYTDPQQLSMHTINKYLELKSRGMI